ncbi:hypothetical protein [Engelhardtia mirabilis]|uniref:Uncharacterized protein n=1 Tax=Engelhardtia mirabilis TaxID=2528011 RepID=A0A518BIK9_9BACT|nr:hypothetical protein Pla133_18960 [Planctomycetes bacterium Pla133]QDV01146.1 hypothetical protein Pla86_18950 [Planctomycetes bacterium Pla86]
MKTLPTVSTTSTLAAPRRFGVDLLSAGCVCLLLLGCASTGNSHEGPGARVAAAYGVDHFGELEALRYTFNADLGEREIARQWEWEPGTGRVAHRKGDELFVYFRGSNGAPESPREVDGQFINDQYWLLFPLHLVWDSGLEITSQGTATGPITGAECEHLICTYSSEVGYTPGDVYELFVDEDGDVREWIFRAAGSEEPTRTAAWSEPTAIGPIRASLEFPGPDPEAFRIWFTDVEYKLAGGEWTAVE